MWFIKKEGLNFLFLPTLYFSYRTSELLPPSFSPNISQIMIGIMLGDGYIQLGKTGKARLHIEGYTKNLAYITHLYDFFSIYCLSGISTGKRIDKKTDKIYSASRFVTRELPHFLFYHNLFYLNSKKIVPLNITDIFTSISLSYWAMDDGGKAGSGFHFYTHSFSLNEVKILSNMLTNKFNLKNSIQSNKNGYRIYIWSKSMELFKSLVESNFHSSMLYKLS
jgi:hypothetical protein